MMILMSQKEYNDLLKKAGNVEQLVEERMQQEKDKLYANLRRAFQEGYNDEMNPVFFVKEKLNQLLR